MTPLEKLFFLELEFHRRLRTDVPDATDVGGLHTSYALQSGYEGLIGAIARVTIKDIDMARARFIRAGDIRDLVSAGESVKQLLGVGP
jgi:hypothetical protein